MTREPVSADGAQLAPIRARYRAARTLQELFAAAGEYEAAGSPPPASWP